jgi:hypothetical protein
MNTFDAFEQYALDRLDAGDERVYVSAAQRHIYDNDLLDTTSGLHDEAEAFKVKYPALAWRVETRKTRPDGVAPRDRVRAFSYLRKAVRWTRRNPEDFARLVAFYREQTEPISIRIALLTELELHVNAALFAGISRVMLKQHPELAGVVRIKRGHDLVLEVA